MEEVTKDDIQQFLRETYEEDELRSQVDEAVLNYVDNDWKEDGEYDDECEWYQDFGRGEAEGEVFDVLLKSIQDKFKLSDTDYFHDEDRLGFSINDAVFECFPFLEVN